MVPALTKTILFFFFFFSLTSLLHYFLPPISWLISLLLWLPVSTLYTFNSLPFLPLHLTLPPVLLLNSESTSMTAAKATFEDTHIHTCWEQEHTHTYAESKKTRTHAHTHLCSHISNSHNYLMQIKLSTNKPSHPAGWQHIRCKKPNSRVHLIRIEVMREIQHSPPAPCAWNSQSQMCIHCLIPHRPESQ